jgi:TonB family protein
MTRSRVLAAVCILASCTAFAGSRYTVHGIAADGRHITAPPDVHRPWASDILKHPQPQLPASLRALHLGGEALCRIIFDVDSGAVRDVVIVKSSGHPELDASIRRTVHRWTVRPGRWREFEIYIGIWPPSSSPHNRPNQAMERTADRCTFTFKMISTLPLQATRALVRRRSSCSR